MTTANSNNPEEHVSAEIALAMKLAASIIETTMQTLKDIAGRPSMERFVAQRALDVVWAKHGEFHALVQRAEKALMGM